MRAASIRLRPLWALLLGLVWLSAARGAAEPASLRVDFLAVGQGDAALITSPTGKTVLIDGGPREAGPALAARIRARTAAPVDRVLLSHRHADHLGGLAEVIRRQGARLFMDAPIAHPSPAYSALLELLAERRVAIRTASQGRTIDLGGGATLRLLGPPEPPIAGSRSDVNANSVVARLEHGRVRMLFMGDAEAVTERWLLREAETELDADLLKVAHHGSRYASTTPFLRAVSPALAVVSCGARNAYGHPHAQALERLERQGAIVYRLDRDGDLTVSSDGRRISVAGHPPPLVWSVP